MKIKILGEKKKNKLIIHTNKKKKKLSKARA